MRTFLSKTEDTFNTIIILLFRKQDLSKYPVLFKAIRSSALMINIFLLSSTIANATNYYTNGNGNPISTSRWWTSTNGSGSHPTDFTNAADNFIIQNGNNMTLSTGSWTIAGTLTINSGGTFTRGTYNMSCGNLVINGTSDNGNGGSFTINGTVSGNGTISGGSTPRVFIVTGNWAFTGSVLSGHVISLTMNGSTDQLLSGTLAAAGTPGALIINKTSGKVTLGSAIDVQGGSFTLTAGTFDPATYLLTASSSIFTAGTLRVGNSTWAGNYSFAITEPAAGTIEYYKAGDQTINNVNYGGNLILSGSGIKTLGTSTTTIGGDLTLSGTATTTTVTGLTINGNLSISGGTTLTAAGFALTANGTTTIENSGTLNISSATGTKTFTGAVTIKTGGLITETAAATLFFGSDVTISGTYTASTGTHTFSGITKTINGAATISIPSISITGTYINNGTLTCNTALSGAGTLANANTLNIGGTCSLTTLSNSGTVGITGTGAISTVLSNFTNTGTINLGGSGNITGITNSTGGIVNLSNSGTIASFNNATSTSVLNISDLTPTITTLTITTPGNTINYSGAGAQSVIAKAYSNLILSGSGAKSIVTGTSVNGNISIAPIGLATASIGSGLTISAGSLTLGGSGAPSGTWGSTSSSATYQNNTYFATTTGKLSLSSNTCTTASIGGNLNICSSFTTQLTGSGTAATTNPWISGTLSVATVNSTGLVTAVSAGTSNITYTSNLGCTQTATVTVNSLPTPTFTAQPGSRGCAGTDVTYTTQSGQLNYAWTYMGTSGTDYQITSGGGNSDSVTIKWLTTGSKTISINYTNVNGCKASAATSSTSTTINPIPNNTSNGFTGGTICAGTTGAITYDAYTVGTPFVSPYKISFTDGTNTWSNQLISSSSPTDIIMNPTASATYTLISITDGNNCTRTSDFGNATAHIAVKPVVSPGAINTLGETICDNGNPTVINNSTLATGGDENITYKWQANGIDISGAYASTYDPPAGLKATTTYTRWANDSTCNTTPTQSTGSWVVTVKPYAPVSINIVASANPACIGTTVSFTTESTNGGTEPTYHWKLNNMDTGTNSAIYTNSALASGDQINCVMTSNETCVTDNLATSAPLIMIINTLPAAPTIGEITQPVCPVVTGSAALNGLPSGPWTINPGNVTGSGGLTIVSGLTAGITNFTVTDESGCTSLQSNPVNIKNIIKKWVGSTNVITGNDWFTDSNWIPEGIPDPTTCIEIPNDTPTVSISGANKTAYTNALIVSNDGKLIVDSGNTLVVQDFIKVDNDGTMTLEDSASLIQINNASDLNKGNINVKRNSAPLILNDYTYWSSPTSGAQTLQNFSPNTNPKYFLTYDRTWTYVNASTTKFSSGIGYAILAPKEITDPTVVPYTFTGVPNNGNITLSVSSGSAGSPSYRLIGNPYPSALDADAFILANLVGTGTNTLSGNLYFWSHNTPYNGSYFSNDYVVYNLGGEVPHTTIPKRWIASGQGFVVQTVKAGSIIFNNTMRTSEIEYTNNNFYKNLNIGNANTNLEKNRIWLNFTNGNSNFSQTLIGYIETATDEYDPGFDATYFSNKKTGIYSLLGKGNYTIQTKGLPFTDSDIVPLGYTTDVKGNSTISIDSTDGLFEKDQDTFLEDKLLNVVHNLKASPYTFFTEAGTFNNRFLLRYNDVNLGINDPKEMSNILISSKNQQIKIQSTMEDISKVFVYDMLGRTIYKSTEIDNKEVLISDVKTQQILIIKVILNDRHSVTKKLVIQ